ncbi:hypothetical protein vseg_014520 [Gypsophila vaccaria]
MDSNEEDAKTKPLISSMKPQREEIEDVIMDDDDDDDESVRLLKNNNGGISGKSNKISRKVQWNDRHGNKLAEILEFQPSDVSDSDDDDADSCYCTIM